MEKELQVGDMIWAEKEGYSETYHVRFIDRDGRMLVSEYPNSPCLYELKAGTKWSFFHRPKPEGYGPEMFAVGIATFVLAMVTFFK